MSNYIMADPSMGRPATSDRTALTPPGYFWKVNPKPTYDGWHAVVWREGNEPREQWNGEGESAAAALEQAIVAIGVAKRAAPLLAALGKK